MRARADGVSGVLLERVVDRARARGVRRRRRRRRARVRRARHRFSRTPRAGDAEKLSVPKDGVR